MKIETLEKSLHWQRYVLANSKDLKQKQRAQMAINRLLADIERAKNG